MLNPTLPARGQTIVPGLNNFPLDIYPPPS